MDLKNLNIWKTAEKTRDNDDLFMQAPIEELNLGVRSFNCLKRAGCNTIKDVYGCFGEDGCGLRKIRNLGSRSEKEILEKLQELKEVYKASDRSAASKQTTLIKPARQIWDRNIEEFSLSNYSLSRLKACGIRTIGDLYATNPKSEPGWYAVRELFGKLPRSSS